MAIAAALPWKSLLQNKLKGLLEAQGFSNVQLTLTDAGAAHFLLKDIAFKKANLSAAIGAVAVNGAPKVKERKIEGQWKINNIQITSDALPLPVFNGNGDFAVYFDRAIIKGFFLADDASQLTFNVNYIYSSPDKSLLTVEAFSIPWGGGKVSAKNIRISFEEKAPIAADLKVEGVFADDLLRQITGNRATATGRISGSLPVTIAPDKSIVFRNGLLQSDAPGILTVSPDIIPGDNAQVALVREILKNFHYDSLSLQLDSGADGKSELNLAIEGKNPQVQQGRAVKMNVNLKGDVLDLVQQNLSWLTDPKKIMERGINAKP